MRARNLGGSIPVTSSTSLRDVAAEPIVAAVVAMGRTSDLLCDARASGGP